MRTAVKASLALVLILIGLFVLAGRPVAELFGLARASADQTADTLVSRVPEGVRDKKLDHDLARQRQSVLDRQIQLGLSQRHVASLAKEVEELQERIARRERMLVEAYPVLQGATEGGARTVRFASVERDVVEFGRELDDLLAQQEREERELDIKRTGLGRLRTSVTDGERALSEMKGALAGLEQEIDILRHRREQAELESETLDLVTAVATPGAEADGSLARAAEELRDAVVSKEVANEARRDLVPAASRGDSAVARDWERLERLKAIYDASQDSSAPVPAASQAADREDGRERE